MAVFPRVRFRDGACPGRLLGYGVRALDCFLAYVGRFPKALPRREQCPGAPRPQVPPCASVSLAGGPGEPLDGEARFPQEVIPRFSSFLP